MTRLFDELHGPRVGQQLRIRRRVAQAGQFEHGVEAGVVVLAARERVQARAFAAPVPCAGREGAARGGVAADLLFAGQAAVVVEAAGQQEGGEHGVAHGARYVRARPLIHALVGALLLALCLVACGNPVEVETVCFFRGHVYVRRVGAEHASRLMKFPGKLGLEDMPTRETPCELRGLP